jgi:hypothetical protein
MLGESGLKVVCPTDELHTALGDGATRQRLRLRADLVHNNHLRHVVLYRLEAVPHVLIDSKVLKRFNVFQLQSLNLSAVDPGPIWGQSGQSGVNLGSIWGQAAPPCLDHDAVLLAGVRHLHAPRAADV